MTRQEAMAYVAEHGPRMTAALQIIVSDPARPLGVLEAIKKRTALGGAGVQECAPENNGCSLAAAPLAPPPACRECGTDLTPHEIARAERIPTDTKYHGLCNECCRLKAGL